MKPKHLQTAIVVLSLLVVGTQPALGTKSILGDPEDSEVAVLKGSMVYNLTFEGYNHNTSVRYVPGTPITFATDWKTICSGAWGVGCQRLW